MHALAQEVRSGRVAEVMRPDTRQVGILERTVLRVTDRAGVEWTTGQRAEHEVSLRPGLAGDPSLPFLSFLVSTECSDRAAGKLDATTAVHRLRVAHYQALAFDPLHGVPNVQGPPVQVDVLPVQPCRLPDPEPCRHEQRP